MLAVTVTIKGQVQPKDRLAINLGPLRKHGVDFAGDTPGIFTNDLDNPHIPRALVPDPCLFIRP